MTTTSHGNWNAYKPSEFPEGAPPHAMYTRRDSDAKDWYAYVQFDEGSPFASSQNVKMTLHHNDGTKWIVDAANFDETTLFPQAGQLVLEYLDYTGTDPHADLVGKIWDETSDVFTDPPPRPQPVAQITRRQLVLMLLQLGLITDAEAIGAATKGELPALVSTYIAALAPEYVTTATVTWASMSICMRNDPMLAAIAAANGLTDEQLDTYFASAAAL